MFHEPQRARHVPSTFPSILHLLLPQGSLLNRIKRSVKYKRLELIPGFYNVSLTDELLRRHRFQPALLVDVDADMYVSTMQCLTWMFQNRLITAGTFVRYDDWPSCIEPDPSKCPPVWGQELAHRHLTETFGIEWKVWDRKVYQVVTCKTCAPTAV